MRIFEDVEMEFFDPMNELPKEHEKVLVILKKGATPGRSLDPLRYATFTKYATVPPKFVEYEKYGNKFIIKQVRCWGRLTKE